LTAAEVKLGFGFTEARVPPSEGQPEPAEHRGAA
jgi:hypothetical protein